MWLVAIEKYSQLNKSKLIKEKQLAAIILEIELKNKELQAKEKTLFDF